LGGWGEIDEELAKRDWSGVDVPETVLEFLRSKRHPLLTIIPKGKYLQSNQKTVDYFKRLLKKDLISKDGNFTTEIILIFGAFLDDFSVPEESTPKEREELRRALFKVYGSFGRVPGDKYFLWGDAKYDGMRSFSLGYGASLGDPSAYLNAKLVVNAFLDGKSSDIDRYKLALDTIRIFFESKISDLDKSGQLKREAGEFFKEALRNVRTPDEVRDSYESYLKK